MFCFITILVSLLNLVIKSTEYCEQCQGGLDQILKEVCVLGRGSYVQRRRNRGGTRGHLKFPFAAYRVSFLANC